MTGLTIGGVARAAAVNIQTVRYYERRGLVGTPRRSAAGYRQYTEEVIPRLRFIKHAQGLGFTLNEIRELLALRVQHGIGCDAVAQRTRQKIALVTERISHLERIRQTLDQLAQACGNRKPTSECPMLEALEENP